MNIYDAAECLIITISRSPDFHITYDDLKTLVLQYNQAITSFFDTETKYDFIFNKFPEIFILKNNIISLTDAYLSIYHHEKPYMSFSSCVLAPDMENCAILYFLKILSLHGPQQYLSLFNMLMNVRTEMCADYFRNYTDLDMFNFFASNKEYFFLSSDIVTATPSILDVLFKRENKAKRKLNEYVCFLLKCFGSLHYFELSKCISYGANCCKTFLKDFSLLKQREHFENLPDTAMDKYGFLSLKNKKDHISFPVKHKIKLLSVCILAFKKEMHFKDLINETILKSKQSVNFFFSRMSTENQLGFFKKLPYYFRVSQDGFVKLLPSFSLPKCSFEDLTSDDSQQVTPELNNVKKIKVEMSIVSSVPAELNKIQNNSPKETLISYQSDTASDEEPKKKKIKVETNISSVHPELNKIQNNSPNETLISYQSDITSDEDPKKKKVKVEMNISSVHPELNKIQSNSPNETLISYQNNITTSDKKPKKGKKGYEDFFNQQVCFVLRCLKSMHYFELRECLSYAVMKNKHFLNKFSEVEQRDYFENIPNTIMDQYGFLRLKNEFVKTPFTHDRRECKMMILLTVCILAFKKKMHFKDLVNDEAIKKSNLTYKYFQSTERQLQFFKSQRLIFVISNDGFVQLLPTFILCKCSFEELSTAFKNSKQNVHSVPAESLASKNLTAKSMTKKNDGACVKVQSNLPQHDFDLSKNNVGISTADQNSVSCKKPSSTSWFNAISF